MIQLFNTLTQKKEDFTPLDSKKVTLYVCGITPYDTTHLGHAFTYITFDVLIKYLTYKEYQVVYTQNVTDINDRDNDILKRAEEQRTTWQQLTEYWTKRFLSDMEALNWTKPNHYLYASQQISSMVSLIQKILEKGYAYEKNGGIYLDVDKYDGYGKLSKLSEEEMLTIAKDFEEDLENPDKKHPLDITLWKPSLPGQAEHIPSFDSPFGKGRPGWHIECSAMSTSTLGEQIDLHGGGVDLIYPHHESEITQSETGTGKIPFANIWMHVNLVQKDHEKMSKSKGNLVLVSDLLKTYSPNALRWYLLSHHYRQSWNFEEKELKEAEKWAKKLSQILSPSKQSESRSNEKKVKTSLITLFEEAMDDDLNTPKVLDMIKEILLTPSHLPDVKKTLELIVLTLGFVF